MSIATKEQYSNTDYAELKVTIVDEDTEDLPDYDKEETALLPHNSIDSEEDYIVYDTKTATTSKQQLAIQVKKNIVVEKF